MRSALWRGIELLNASGSDSVQSQRQTIENPASGKSASEHMEAIVGVPKTVTRLKPVINELMRKVIMIAI